MTTPIYIKPRSADEAAAALREHPEAALVGGGAYLRLGGRRPPVLIDLFEAGLDGIAREGDAVALGAMATFRQVETSPLLAELADGLLPRSVRNIGGVQMRNIVTVGGTVAGRYGFANLLTALLALDAAVEFHPGERVPLADYLAAPPRRGRLLTRVLVPAAARRGAWHDLTLVRADFAVLNVAAVRGEGYARIAVGARPAVAMVAAEASACLAGTPDGIAGDDLAELAAACGEAAAAELEFGDDLRGGADYRRLLCRELTARAVREVLS